MMDDEQKALKPSPIQSRLDKAVSRWIPQKGEQFDWQQDVHRAYLEQEPLRARIILYALVVVVLSLLVWASFAEIDEVTRGQGKVIPSQQIQVVQSQDGGMVSEILVHEGDVVEAGQLLLRLDQTRFQSSFRENRSEYQALMVKSERLLAVAGGRGFAPSEELRKAVPRIVDQEQAIFESSKAQLNAEKQIAAQQLIQRQQELIELTASRQQLKRSLQLVRQEMGITRPMVSSGAVSEVELLRLEREVNRLNGEHEQSKARITRIESAINEAERKLEEVELEFLNDVREEIAQTMMRINSLKETGTGLSDRVDQTAVRSPVRGTVSQLFYYTVGGVVLAGKEIAEIVPMDDTLLLEARIRPKDIAFLVPGQKALIKFSAYDFVVYGGMEAVLEHIGADTVTDEEGNPFYTVRLRTSTPDFAKGKPIIPGMTAEVDILTGKKTILAYLLKPILRAKQYALTER
ncbi:MAG: HlyD family type I secretion periplasmic adaptor subunit [Pseudomonadales bacterium]